MNTVKIIIKKRNNIPLSQKEIEYIIKGAVEHTIPDYQLSAFLMAAFINGLNDDETFFITNAMLKSGQTLVLSNIQSIKADKHSTGGVADTTTLILSPAVASLGVPVIKMSGRGLGFSGGTIDKLLSIPGFKTDITVSDALNLAQKSNIVIMGQTKDIVPADKILYSLRDVTGTVESIPLIVSSIVSKKIATNSDVIIYDVKCGSGAFMKDINSARSLSEKLISISKKFGKRAAAIISSMEQPLGNNIGNSLEVIEAIEILKGNYLSSDLYNLVRVLGGVTLFCCQKATDIQSGSEMIDNAIKSGYALEKFIEFISQQGGNTDIINDYSLLPQSKYKKEFLANETGYISKLDAQTIGMASVETGAGRKQKDDYIDFGAGIIINSRIGDYVKKGDIIATIYSSSQQKLNSAYNEFISAVEINRNKPPKQKLVIDVIV